MSNYFYKTKKVTVFTFAPIQLVKTADEIYTSLSIINNSEYEIRVIEHDGTGTPDFTEGTILGSKKMLTYDNVPKNAVYIYGNTPVPKVILAKYSE